MGAIAVSNASFALDDMEIRQPRRTPGWKKPGSGVTRVNCACVQSKVVLGCARSQLQEDCHRTMTVDQALDFEMPALADDAPHILVVDDDERIRDLLGGYLRQNGFRVTQAENGAAARSKLRGLAFDCIILDVMMPGESGFDIAGSLRKT